MLSAIIGIVGGVLTALAWFLLERRYALNAENSTTSNDDSIKSTDPQVASTTNIETRESKREPTAPCESDEKCSASEEKGVSQANTVDSANLKTKDSEAGAEERELMTKEKFYLFLEKGFCPELEKGVKDPLYKYLRSSGGEPAEPSSLPDDLTGGFCPMMGMLEGEGESETENNEELSPSGALKNEIDELERMMHRGAQRGEIELGESVFSSSKARCPFASPTKSTAATACPFKNAIDSSQDEESLADIPKSHCGRFVSEQSAREDKDIEMITTIKELEKTNKERRGGDGDGELAEEEVLLEDILLAPTRSQEFRIALNSVESSLSSNEIEQEVKVREQQMAAIMNLMQTEQEKLGQVQLNDIQTQLNMYV